MRLLPAVIILLLAAPARAYRTPLNPRRHKKKKPAAVAVSTATAASPQPEDGLPPGRWSPEVRAAILRFVLEKGKGSPGYDAARPPVAVLPFDHVAVAGDPGEVVFGSAVDQAAFKFSDDFWKEVPIAYGRQPLRAAYEQFSSQPASIWGELPTYHQFCGGFRKSYRDMCRELDRKDCRAYLARLLIGFGEDEALKFSEGALAAAGLKDVPEIRALVRFLQAQGIDVWFVELDPQVVLVAAAEGWPVPKERLLGIRQGLSHDKLDGQPLEPIPIRDGKVAEVVQALQRPPDLVLGRSIGDAELLSYSPGLRLVLAGDAQLMGLAKKNGWLVQPAF